MNAELAKIARDMRGLERELWRGKKMGEFAMALSLDAYADRIEQALGVQPRPRNAECRMQNAECGMKGEGLRAENARAWRRP